MHKKKKKKLFVVLTNILKVTIDEYKNAIPFHMVNLPYKN